MKKRYIVLGAFGGLVAIINMASESQKKVAPQSALSEAVSVDPSGSASPIAIAANSPEVDNAQSLTGPQRNAVRSAKQYLSMQGFSRAGLIEQLSSDAGNGYDLADATIAVDSLGADWNEHAARSAKQYLTMMGFSCKGLIEQLSSSAGNKYTVEQATYGAKQAGAC